MTVANVAVFLVDQAPGSYHRRIAETLSVLAPATLVLNVVPHSLPPHDTERLEWLASREVVDVSNAILLVTSDLTPAALRDFAATRQLPPPARIREEKPVAILSVAAQVPGGGFGAIQHLGQCFMFMNTPRTPRCESGPARRLFDLHGSPADDAGREFLCAFLSAFAAWVMAHRPCARPDAVHGVSASRTERPS